MSPHRLYRRDVGEAVWDKEVYSLIVEVLASANSSLFGAFFVTSMV